MCGEKMMKAGSNCAMLGSPPRMRGKAELGHAQQLLSGITPAYAGKSLKFCERCALGKDHPRVCGEKLTRHLTASGGRGSPPRMRGKVLAALVLPSPTRITPAYAGKSVAHFGLMQLVRDHPRVCGEKLFLPEPHPVGTGSPPRMRGKGCSAGKTNWTIRITPAYAGKRQALAKALSRSRDHPRVCGEKHLCTQLQRPSPGSPPRMRGKGADCPADRDPDRITPAYAGKSYHGQYLQPL